MKPLPTRQRYPDDPTLSRAFARYACGVLAGALQQRQRASLVLPGGGTPCRFLPALVRRPLAWERVAITLSDERWVTPDSGDSNQVLVEGILSGQVAGRATLVGLKAAGADPAQALEAIEQRLRGLPLPFDLTVLGLGRDGHIASLFPGHDSDSDGLCVAVQDCPAPRPRVSLGLAAIAASRHIALVYMDAGKCGLMDAVLAGAPGTRELPVAQLLQATDAPVAIFETLG